MKILRHIALFSLLAVPVLAQDDPIRVETNLVTLNVSVTDRRGNFVRGLTRQDFAVRDNGLVQEVDAFSTQDAPVSFGIIYDLHPTTDERTLGVLDALRKFTATLGPSDDFFVTVFNEMGSLTTEFVPTDRQLRTHVEVGANSL
jgi:Ca-activated chloride channel homolog